MAMGKQLKRAAPNAARGVPVAEAAKYLGVSELTVRLWVLADVFPGLSPVGRRKRAKPPCCDDPERPPVIPATLSEQLAGMFGYS